MWNQHLCPRWEAQNTYLKSLQLQKTLHQNGIAAEVYPDEDKLKKQLKYADRKGVAFVLLAGPAEIAAGEYVLKDMQSGEQENVNEKKLIERLA